jgi:deoxyribonuclease V
MIACIDVGYGEEIARAACVTFEHWRDEQAAAEFVADIEDVEEYVPGEFYRRELPCSLIVLEQVPQADLIVIDGYVWLDESQRPGFGAFLYEAFDKQIPVVGVAKTRFATASQAVEVYRGCSQRPLYVTAAGLDLEDAADSVRQMHGKNRIPTLLKRVDSLSRDSSMWAGHC